MADNETKTDSAMALLAKLTQAVAMRTGTQTFDAIFGPVSELLAKGEKEQAKDLMHGLMPVEAAIIGFHIDWVHHLTSQVGHDRFREWVTDFLPRTIENEFNSCVAEKRGKIKITIEYTE